MSDSSSGHDNTGQASRVRLPVGFALTAALAVLVIPVTLRSYPLPMLTSVTRWPLELCVFLVKPLATLRLHLITGHAGSILFLALLAILAHAVGARSMRYAGAAAPDREQFSGFALPLGLGILGMLAAILCWMQLFNRPVFTAASLGLAFLCRKELAGDGRRLLAAIRRLRQGWPGYGPGSILTAAGWLLVAFLITYSFIYSLAPPHQSDGIRYHLSVPKLYAALGGFTYLPHSAFSNFPFTVEMLFGTALLFPGGIAARGIHWLYLIAMARVLYVSGKRHGAPTAGLLSVLLFVSIPFVPLLSSWAFIEVALACMVFLSLHAFTLWAESRGWLQTAAAPPSEKLSRFCLVGSLGLSVGMKYTSVFFAAILFLCALLLVRKQLRNTWKPILAAFVLAGVAASPWYVKNLAVTGNPVFPLANGIFKAPDWSEAETALYYYHAGMKGRLNWVRNAATPAEQAMDLASLPFRAVMANSSRPVEWNLAGLRLFGVREEGFGNWPIGWGPLVLLPLVLTIRRFRQRALLPLAYAAALFVFWAYTYRDNRFLLPSLALVCPLIGAAVSESLASGPLRRLAVGALAVLAIIYGALSGLHTAFTERNVLPVVNGLVSEDDFLARQQNSYPAMKWLNENAGGPVLFEGEYRTYYADFEYVASDFFNTPVLWKWAKECESVEDLVKRVSESAEWLLVNDAERDLILNGFPLFWTHFLSDSEAVALTGMASRIRSPEDYAQLNTFLGSALQKCPAYHRYMSFMENRLETVKTLNGSRICRLRSVKVGSEPAEE